MKIQINNHRKTFAIQEEFHNAFQNLKIEFHEKPSKPGGTPSLKFVKSSKTMAECRTIHRAGSISILSEMTAGDLKQNFSDVYGLSIEIFQKSKDKNWPHESTVDEKETLEKLNENK